MRKLNLKDESGQTMILTVLCMTILLGFVGLAADVGIMFHAKRNLQIAADSAAIAAASESNYGDWNAAGLAAATQNGVSNGANGAVVVISNGPSYGAFAGQPGYFEAIVTQNQPTIFAALFNLFSINVSARAVATMNPGGDSMNPGGNCIYALGPIGSDITVNSPSTVAVPNCSVLDDSGDSAALVVNGTMTASSIGVVGGVNGQPAPNPVTGIAPVANPLAYLPPLDFNAANCLPDPGISVSQALPQGCYLGLTINGGAPGAVTVTLSGTYIINGALTITGFPTITGADLMFYLPVGATANFGSSPINTPTLSLSAPTTGAYNGILLYQDLGSIQPVTLYAAAGSSVEGIIYAPSANVTVNTLPGADFYTSIVAGSLTLNGTGTMQDYALINNASVLTAATLVE